MSRGHFYTRFWIDVYANDAAQAVFSKSSRDPFAPGAMLVADEFERGVAGETRGPTLVMEKRERGFDPANGDWRYVVVEASGRVAADGKVEACAACHVDAPRDHVFPIVE
jgi:hypothetical protein